MNELAILNQTVKTMSSREMADLCQKRHDNVLQLVRSLIEGGVLKSTTPHNYIHPQNGQTYVEYLSDKRDSLVIVARLSPEFTAAVIDRWQELENQNAITIPQTLPEALRLAADLAEQNTVLAVENAELKPKAEALDIITHAKGNQNVRDTSKVIGINQNKFVDWCIEHTWVYRDDSGRLKAHQQRINQGFMAQKSVIYEGSDGTERVTMQPMFTPKGITHLAKIHSKAVA